MNTIIACRRVMRAALLLACAGLALNAVAAPLEPVLSLAAKEKAPFLDTLKDLVSIESGSGDREGLDKISELIAGRLRALGGAVEFIEPDPADIYPMVDTPKKIGRMVHARFTGTGTKKCCSLRTWTPSTCAACWPTSRFASTATAPTASASPTTSRASP